MYITRFIRDRSDEQLERIARDGVRWDSRRFSRRAGVPMSVDGGCLLCNTFDVRGTAKTRATESAAWQFEATRRILALEYGNAEPPQRYAFFPWPEAIYMAWADKYGEERTGKVMASLARRELGRRAMAAIPELEVPAEAVTVA